MKKLLQKRLNNEKGLTLVELLAVIVILGIIAAIAIPSIGGIIENSRIKAVKADALNALSAANIYFTEEDKELNVTLEKLKSSGYLESEGSLTAGTITKSDPNKFEGAGTSGSVTVTFNAATTKGISNSLKDEKIVGN